MGNIINLKQHNEKHKTNDIITLAVLESLEQITQEINLTLQCLKRYDVNLLATLPRVKDTVRGEYFCTLAELCSIHGENLKNIAKALDINTPPLNTTEQIEAMRRADKLAEKYFEHSIIGHHLENHIAELVELDSI